MFHVFQSSGGVDFRTKLDMQRGAVVATELKNNSFKLAKWTAGAILAGSDQLKFGYVPGCCCTVKDVARDWLCVGGD